MSALPIHAVLPDLLAALATGTRALLIAPPGAGKTTGVPPALLSEQWCKGQVLLLVPRRIAARAAAEFMASQARDSVGHTFGYQTRLDSKAGRDTRVIAMTHGVFLSRLQRDPELAGVSAVLFDEVHERSLDNDLALALTLDAASALRPDLRLVAMSATLDAERFGKLLGDAPRIESDGKSYPLTIEHIGRDTAAPVERQVVAACHRALKDHPGSLLAFLPGVAEIERTAGALGGLPQNMVVHRLHGGVEPREQRLALAAPAPGQRKLVLATSIAETSVTVEDVRIVVDSGLARRPRYDVGAGLTRLVTERASRAAVTQRSGRAARQAPGIAIRLWEEAANASLPAHEPPEIMAADLSSLLLTCLMWGESDPARLPWLDPLPEAALADARRRLERLDAIGTDGQVTAHGRAIGALPLEPRLAHMLVEASGRGFGGLAAEIAALLGERGLGGNDSDLELRRRRWLNDKSARAVAARGMATRWARHVAGDVPQDGGAEHVGHAVALAFPDRLSRRRDKNGENWQSVGGRGFRLDPTSPLATSEWLAVAEVAGRASGARILSAAAIEEEDVVDLFRDSIEERRVLEFDSATGSAVATRTRRLGAITLASGPDSNPDQSGIERTLCAGVRTHGLHLLPWSDGAGSLRERTLFASRLRPDIPALTDEMLVESLDRWLAPLLVAKRRLSEVDPVQLRSSLEGLIGYAAMQLVAEFAPADFVSPAGSRHPIDYAAAGGPTVEVRAQALFGLTSHPMLARGQVPLTLAITSPAGRPIQTSRDLPSFWSGSWREVAKEMRGRYPRHPWPDDPATAPATLRTKRADQRRR